MRCDVVQSISGEGGGSEGGGGEGGGGGDDIGGGEGGGGEGGGGDGGGEKFKIFVLKWKRSRFFL